MESILVPLFCFCLLSFSKISAAVDTIAADQSLRDGETIVSSGELFELGFFTPANSQNRYLGIWYRRVSNGTIVWVANRDFPLKDKSGVLTLTNQGILVLVNGNNTNRSTIWYSNSTRSARNPTAQLLESGNLVLRDGNELLWQSFDHYDNTLLPGMKLGVDKVSGLNRYLSSWKSDIDPAESGYTYGCDPHGYPQFVVKNVSAIMYRLGPWNGIGFSGLPNLRINSVYNFTYVSNDREVYYSYELRNSSVVSRFVLNPNGNAQRYTWVDRMQNWQVYITVPTDNCDNYKLCGAYGSCNIGNSPACGCLDKFKPKYPNDWNMADWSNGCVREKPLDCQKGDKFLKYSRGKRPDTRDSWYNDSMTLEECESECLKNCSCMAYTNLDVRNGGTGCLLWFGDLVDMRATPEDDEDIYIRMSSSETVTQAGSSSNKNKKNTIIISLVVSFGVVMLGLSLTVCIWRKRKNKTQQQNEGSIIPKLDRSHSKEREKGDLPLFDIETMVYATNDFSINNKLGEGGFGTVYQGKLEDGQEIAVKRLSKDSRQGLDEFKNEVICIAKLQHRNLVKLLGCCIQGEEKMLIYEYMPNRSLDWFIFDEIKSTRLDWPKRFNIINGVARGLLYLHQDSRLRIIHRDLKASNILLDNDLNPKISDFGMARIFGGNETEANTSRVVGTYGYMAPEYAIDGLFSVKSDAFSFGVLVLEIVSGRRNRGFFHPDHNLNLLGHAWTLYKEGRSLELVAAPTKNSSHLSEILRSIHVALLCVQQSPEDRPSMSSVVQMLGSKSSLPQPKEPGFFTERSKHGGDTSSSANAPISVNELTITQLQAR